MKRDNRQARAEPLPPERRELLDALDVGRLLGVNRGLIVEWNRLRLMPAPLEIGRGVVKFRTREILAWIDAGAPIRADWRYTPNIPAKLEEVAAMKRARILELEAEIADLDDLRQHRVEQVNVTLGR